MKKGFTLLEVMAVVTIICVFAALAVPAYNRSKEITYDHQAKADLKLMIMSEKNYYLDMGYYYPSGGGTESNISTINRALVVSLPADSDRRWDYSVKSTAGAGGTACCQATRVGGDGRTWHMDKSDTEPSSGACP